MAKHQGKLPADDMATLLAACERLGIDATRLADEAMAFTRLRNINARVAEIEARNVARRESLPALAASLQEKRTTFQPVNSECTAGIKAAAALAAEKAIPSITAINNTGPTAARKNLVRGYAKASSEGRDTAS